MSGATLPSTQEILAGNIRRAAEMFAYWVSTTPEEKLHWIPGEAGISKARPAIAYVNECVRLNRRFAALLSGGAPKATENATNSEEAQKALTDSSEELAGAVANLKAEQLGVEYQLPMGEMTALDVILFAASHLDYHGGQLNLCQCMYGDDEFRVPGDD